MSEPQPDLPAQSAPTDGAAATAVESAFDMPSALPFFDLDIALIRRGQSSAKPQAVVQPKPLIMQAPNFTRERKALDALETLLAERALARPQGLQSAPVPLFPQATPTAAPALKAEPKYIEPRVMPLPPQVQISSGFVSTGFERIDAPVTEAGEPLAALATALLQTASDVTAQAADLLPDLKLQLVRQALARREAVVFKAQRVAMQAAWRPAPQTATAAKAAPQTASTVDADDLPWGHVTYRLLVM